MISARDFVEPEYVTRLRQSPTYAKLTVLQIELRLASFYGVERLTGKTQHEHRLQAFKWMFPSRVSHPWRALLLEAFQRCRDDGIKELMLLGSSNSTKTSTLADLIIEVWMECPEATSIYLCSPYEDATETGLWARVLEQFQEAKDENPELPGRAKLSENKIILADNNPLSFIKVVTIDQVGKLVGKKAKHFNIGFMLIVADELPEFKQAGRPLVRVMNNLISVPNMMLIGAGNFASPNDALGTFAEPDLPGGYHDLRVHVHYEWRSRRGGLVLRFDADRSPGLQDPIKYFFLPGEEYRQHLLRTSGGPNSADYYRYWHSFPLMLIEEYTVTNLVKLRGSGAFETYEWTDDSIIKGSHCDPGFGGDPAVIQRWRLGYVYTKDNSKVQVFEAWGEPVTIPIDVSGDNPLTAEAQIVLFHRELAERDQIPVENCSFDGSMRASIVQDYGRLWSLQVTAIDSGGKPTTRPVSLVNEIGPKGEERTPATWREKVTNFATELWMAGASLILSGQVRGLREGTATIDQLIKRRWSWEGKNKKQIEPKPEFKKNNSGKSPNEADALIGGIEIARRRGLQLIGLSRSVGGSLRLLQQMQEERKHRQLRQGLLLNQHESLRSGHLHGRSRQSTNGIQSGKLRRHR